MEFKDRLKISIERAGINKYRLSKELNCPESTVRSWFNGKMPRISYMNKLCSILQVSPAWLQYGEEKHGPTLNRRALALVHKIVTCGEEALVRMDKVFDIWYGEKYSALQKHHPIPIVGSSPKNTKKAKKSA